MRSTCENVNKIYKFHIQNYEKCEKNQGAFCEELNNFKEAYNNKRSKATYCAGLSQILPPTEVDNSFAKEKKNEINKIEKEKTECLENILDEVNENCEESFHNIGYKSQRET
ncbi:PIR Superfamily Protein [Plasmodium malariae]|uniref:PIR Superfamily Protein n=1 Tax=Plasmodium malariae TaxID=5858 RepID=A0A1A8WV80_PLAMA|nr:PIR Superfamily Protein [Plasmodium malariae]